MMGYLQYLLLFPLFFYIFLIIRKIFRKNWIANTRVLSVFKYLIFIPFWLAYLYFIFPFVIPELNNTIKPPDSSQELLIENNQKSPQNFLLYGRKFRENKWLPAYQYNFSMNKSAVLSIEPNEMVGLKFPAGTKNFDILAISRIDGDSYKDKKSKTIAFNIPSNKIKVFSSQFNKPAAFVDVSISTNTEILLLLLSLTAVFGILYHSTSTRAKNKKLAIAIYSLYALFISLSAYLSYQLFVTLRYLLL